MSTQYQLETDVKEALTMAKGLEDYVRGQELYGNSGGGFFSKMPALTVGALAMRLRRLEVLSSDLTAEQRQQARQAQTLYDDVAKEWRVHFEEKVLREINSRVDAMRQFFQEAKQNAKSASGNYLPEVLRRTIIQELLIVVDTLGIEGDNLRPKVKVSDTALRTYSTQPSDFIWNPLLQQVYSPQVYWWLYHRPESG